MPRYLVELYLPRIGAGGLADAAGRARAAADQLARDGVSVRYLRSIFVPEDETCFLLYDAPTAAAVEQAVAHAALPFDRVLEAVTQP
jgi:hypothetical protein